MMKDTPAPLRQHRRRCRLSYGKCAPMNNKSVEEGPRPETLPPSACSSPPWTNPCMSRSSHSRSSTGTAPNPTARPKSQTSRAAARLSRMQTWSLSSTARGPRLRPPQNLPVHRQAPPRPRRILHPPLPRRRLHPLPRTGQGVAQDGSRAPWRMFALSRVAGSGIFCCGAGDRFTYIQEDEQDQGSNRRLR